MARSFYENQHSARRKSVLLVAYFIAAVVLIVLAVIAVVYIALRFGGAIQQSFPAFLLHPISAWIAAGTLALIAGGSVFRALQIGGNGARVAQLAGGLPVNLSTTDPLERRLINVTEEMAIAAGAHLPKLYLLRNESSINAFVAGLGPNHTVLAVTQGALEQLDRNELQGVIGHEFSHILNGDVRINMRLISILAGILLLGQVGEFLLRGTLRTGSAGRRSSNSKDQSAVALVGLGLMIVGYIGLFFGRLIKSAISRQREFLADASSVQFTRDPMAIGGALYKIGHGGPGSYLADRHAEELNHLCFSETLTMNFSRWLASHPPIDERIKAIDPSIPARMRSRARLAVNAQTGSTAGDGATEFTSTPAAAPVGPATTGHSMGNVAVGLAGSPPQRAGNAPQRVSPHAVKASIGTASEAHHQAAQQLLDSLPHDLTAQAHHQQGAETLLCALIMTAMRSHGQEALACLRSRGGPGMADSTARTYRRLREVPIGARLPLLDIALATLSATPKANRQRVLATLDALIAVDNTVSLTEFVVHFLAQKFLTEQQPAQIRHRNFTALADTLNTLFTALAVSASSESQQQQQLLRTGLAVFSLARQTDDQPLRMPNKAQLNDALQQLSQLTPLLKQPVLDACIDCVMADNQVTPSEAELLRAISSAMDCPMPLILPDLPVNS